MSAQDDKHSASCERHTGGLCVCGPAVSARDELPPGWEYTTAPSNEAVARGPVGLSSWTAAPGRDQCAKDAWRLWSRASGITIEELATMRAAVARCAELETALAKVTAERAEARRMAEIRLRAIESMRRAALRATSTEGGVMLRAILLSVLAALAMACEYTIRAVLWGWERPRMRAPVWIAGLVLLVPLHAAPELLERFEG